MNIKIKRSSDYENQVIFLFLKNYIGEFAMTKNNKPLEIFMMSSLDISDKS